ncbi:MAG TPA: 50S ribosomal protein L18 [Verrucomicrobiae bacterium]|nr:50S ribosomal protein L18 [Verrucomicrobiae bacterium]
MIKRQDRREVRKKRHLRVRKHIFGTNARPRLTVFRSLKHIYAQIIDDVNGVTLVAASSLEPSIRDQIDGGNVEGAGKVGELIAKKALEKGITTVSFDRGGNLYHGRIAALAEAARQAGLEF